MSAAAVSNADYLSCPSGIQDYCTDKHRNVDDKPFGGGPGMLMKTEPLLATIGAARAGLGEQEEGSRGVFISRLKGSGSIIRR